MSAACDINANSPHQGGIFLLYPVHGLSDDFRVTDVHSAVSVQIIHQTVPVIVDKNVSRVAVHVPAQIGPPLGVAAGEVVIRRAKAAHDGHSAV